MCESNFGFFIIISNYWIISVIETSQSTAPELKLALLVVCGGGLGVRGW